MRWTYIAAVIIAFFAMPALAQAPADGTRVRVVGAVDKLDGNNLSVHTRDGSAVTVVLADNAVVFGVEKRAIADVKPGDYLRFGRGQGHRRQDPCGRGAHHARSAARYGRRPAPVGRQARRGHDQRHGRHGHPVAGGRSHPCQVQGRRVRIHGRARGADSWPMSPAIAACSSPGPRYSRSRRRNPTAL